MYATTGSIASAVGTGVWVSYAIAALLAALTGLTYAELVSRYPKAGGAAHFVREIFGNPLLTFMVIFFVALSGLFSVATASHTVAKFSSLAFREIHPILTRYAIPVIYLLMVGFVVARGISQGRCRPNECRRRPKSRLRLLEANSRDPNGSQVSGTATLNRRLLYSASACRLARLAGGEQVLPREQSTA